MNQLPLPFKERLPQFAKTIPSSECIDDLPQTQAQRAAKKADFFFENRRIVCEVKNLETDTTPKLKKLLEPLEKRPEWPRFYGAWELSKILRKFPDGAEINRRVFESTTSAINKAVADANRQIVTVSVSHRSDQTIRANPDLRGRVVTIDIPYWKPEELQFIPKRGFPLLNANPDFKIIERLVTESLSSPQLMQSLCLQLCRDNGLEYSTEETRNVSLTEEE